MTEANSADKLSASLTPKQRRLAELLCDPDFAGNITELCRKVGVARSTFYRLQKNNADFREYVTYLIDSYTDSELAGVWRSLIRKCNTGDASSIKLFFELKGKYRQQVDISGGVVFLTGEDERNE